MEAKKGSETAQNAKSGDLSSTWTRPQDSAPGIETSNREAFKEPKTLPTTVSASETQQAVMKLVDTEKISNEAKSAEKSAGEKIPISGTNEIQLSNNKAPAASNDQVTSENTQQTFQESADGMNRLSASERRPQATAQNVDNLKPVDTSLSSKPAKEPDAGSTSIPSTGLKDSVVVTQSQTLKTAPTQPPAPPSDTSAPTPTSQSQPPMKPSVTFPLPVAPKFATNPNPVPPQMQQMVTRGFGPSHDETIARLRAPLTDAYGSFIYPTDTSLTDARQRLRTALEQTRLLREAFTDRVYKKYRIILKPVQKSGESIIDPIIADPVTVSRKLYEQMNEINEEKAMEKKEASKWTSAKAPVGPDSSSLANAAAAETAEQVQFLSAGLSLVVLPEDEVDKSQIDLSQYKYRGPINPETGQRVIGLSAATATAAETLLDRVRRGRVLRIERQRRRQLQILSGESAETAASYSSSMHFLSGGASSRQGQKKAKDSRKTSPLYPAAIKASRSRVSTALTGSNLLSLSPSAEELKPEAKRGAATAALIAKSVGITRTMQQRWRHPHPESLGGRRVSTSATGQNSSSNIPEYVARSLPPLPILSMKQKQVKVLNDSRPGTERARMAVRTVLEQFVDTKDLLTAYKNEKNPESGTSSKPQIETESIENDIARNTKKSRKRGATEIGLRRALQYAPQQGTKWQTPAEAGSKPNVGQKRDVEKSSSKEANSVTQVPGDDNASETPLPPALAFSVMHALGLVRESARERKTSFQNIASLLDFSISSNTATEDEKSPGDRSEQSESRLKVISEKILGHKRSFAHAFFSSASHSSSDNTDIAFEDADVPAGDAECTKGSEETNSPRKMPRGEMQDEERTSSNGCPVLSIRGGGESEDGAENRNRESAQRSKSPDRSGSRPSPTDGDSMSPSAQEPSFHNQAMLSELTQHPLTLLQTRRPASASDAMYPGHSSPTRNASPGLSSNDRSGALHRQYRELHGSSARAMQLSHDAYSMNRFSSSPSGRHGDISDYYGVPHSSQPGYGSRGEWASLGLGSTGSSGYLPSSRSSLASLGLTGHHAAITEMTVRDRARQLLAREQQQNAAVAAHAAAQRHSNISGFSQASGLMGPSSSHGAPDYYGHTSSGGRYSQHLSRAQSAPAVPNAFHGGIEVSALSRISVSKKRKAAPRTISSGSSSSKKADSIDQRKGEEDTGNCQMNRAQESSEDNPGRMSNINGKLPAVSLIPKTIGGEGASLESANSPKDTIQDQRSLSSSYTKTGNPGVVSTDGSSSSCFVTSGMQFMHPPTPTGMTAEMRDLVLGGSFYSVLDDNEASTIEPKLLIQYLLAVGTAVPIPKATISNPLKEKLSTPGFKSHAKDGAPPIPRDVSLKFHAVASASISRLTAYSLSYCSL